MADKGAIRTALYLAAAYNPEAEHLDIESAFLHELLAPAVNIYNKQLPQFDGSYKNSNCVGILRRNVYDIKQGCRSFTTGVAENLKLLNFNRSNADACSFSLEDKVTEAFGVLVITVDNFLVAASTAAIINTIKQQLRTKYNLHDLGPLKLITNWKVERNRKRYAQN